MSVQFLDLQDAYRELQHEIDAAAVARVLASGSYVGGPELAAFEADFAAYCRADHCVGVGNGLDALRLALRAMDVGPGDEVIVASNTFIATWLAVTMVGAIPVPVEPDEATHNLDPTLVATAITSRTRAILPTHLYGQPADLDPLIALARDHGLRLLEDAAQVYGACYKGRRIGGHGDMVAWSFYPGKNLGALGDGGAITTNDPVLAERVRMLGNYGSRERYVNDEQGTNSRLDPLQASILAVKLRYLGAWNARRAAIATYYSSHLAASGLILPVVPDWADPAWHLYVVGSTRRDALGAALRSAGVHTLVHYPIPPHLQRAYRQMGIARGKLPIAERLASQVISLPMSPHHSMAEIDEVIAAVTHLTATETLALRQA